jgi:hypothetical protein
MYRERRMFSIGQDDFQSPVPHIFSDVVGIQAGQTATGCSRRHGGADTVDGAPRYELNGSRNGRPFRRDETPSVETKIAERDDVVLSQICRFFDGGCFARYAGEPTTTRLTSPPRRVVTREESGKCPIRIAMSTPSSTRFTSRSRRRIVTETSGQRSRNSS